MMVWIKNKKGELEYFGVGYPSQEQIDKAMGKPKCPTCGKEMKNAVDSITKKISEYLWETTCGHAKGLLLSRG